MKRLIFIIACVALVVGCSRQHDVRLDRVAAFVSDEPEQALAALDSIAYDSLSTADRHYHDFLTIKAADKAYITHTSDSLILDVIDYYEGTDLYPEALYYGGRVYSDLGDYPTALDYFHQALDKLPEDASTIELRKRVLSQTGRLLTNLRLYDEAVPYIKKSLYLFNQNKDTANIIYSLQLLGDTYIKADKLAEAKSSFEKSLNLSYKYHESTHIAKSKMYMAAVNYKAGNIEEALFYIRNTPNNVKATVRNSALAYASQIFLRAGKLDTAYLYAHQLINSSDPLNHEIGYHTLLSSELRNYIPADTANKYLDDYCDLLEGYYDENQSLSTSNKENSYNYQIHEREKNQALNSNRYLWLWVYIFIFITTALCFVILFLKNRNKSRIIALQQALENVKILAHELKMRQDGDDAPVLGESKSNAVAISSVENKKNQAISYSNKKLENELREKLRNKLLAIVQSHGDTSISDNILKSNVYKNLLLMIDAKESIGDKSTIWDEIENVVLEDSPKFENNLNLLTQGKITLHEMRAALLLKCGFKPSQMTILLGRTNGAIISRRNTLCLKVLDEKTGVKTIDKIIRLL